MDSDEVMVMDAGQVVEMGHPHELLQKPDGYFANMVNQVEEEVQTTLKAIAQQAYAARDNKVFTTESDKKE